MKTFDFSEALSFIKADMPVSITINNVERVYKLNDKGEIICIPKGAEHLAYKVNTFYTDAVMSDEWKLV